MLGTFAFLFKEQFDTTLSTLQHFSYNFNANYLVFLLKVFQVPISLQLTLQKTHLFFSGMSGKRVIPFMKA